MEGQIGLEKTFDEYVARLVEVFREVRRVLCKDGTLWLNLGDSYAGCRTGADRPPELGHTREDNGRKKTGKENKHIRPNAVGGLIKPKDLIGIPWRVVFALQSDGWYLRQDIIWHKPNPMPESVKDRCTKAHEYIFLLSKSKRYFFDSEAIKEKSRTMGKSTVRDRYNSKLNRVPGRRKMNGLKIDNYPKANKRSVWTISTQPFHGNHFAVFPERLVETCLLAGCPEGGTALDPFLGSGTTLVVAVKNRRGGIGIELNDEYVKIAYKRLDGVQVKML